MGFMEFRVRLFGVMPRRCSLKDETEQYKTGTYYSKSVKIIKNL